LFQAELLLESTTLSHRSVTNVVRALMLDPAKLIGFAAVIAAGLTQYSRLWDLLMEKSVVQVIMQKTTLAKPKKLMSFKIYFSGQIGIDQIQVA
jgi:hypothetical protein